MFEIIIKSIIYIIIIGPIYNYINSFNGKYLKLAKTDIAWLYFKHTLHMLQQQQQQRCCRSNPKP